jgi:hypothetical protein
LSFYLSTNKKGINILTKKRNKQEISIKNSLSDTNSGLSKLVATNSVFGYCIWKIIN